MAPKTRAAARREDEEMQAAIRGSLVKCDPVGLSPQTSSSVASDARTCSGNSDAVQSPDDSTLEENNTTGIEYASTGTSAKEHKIVTLKYRLEGIGIEEKRPGEEVVQHEDIASTSQASPHVDSMSISNDVPDRDTSIVRVTGTELEGTSENPQDPHRGLSHESPIVLQGKKNPAIKTKGKPVAANAKGSNKAPKQQDADEYLSGGIFKSEQVAIVGSVRRRKAKDLSSNDKVLNAGKQTTKSRGRQTARKPASGIPEDTKAKPLKVEYSNKYQVKFGYSRYSAQGIGPTKEQVCNIFEILRNFHAKDNLKFARDNAPVQGPVAGPLHASSELTVDAFVQTILSQTTTNEGALKAYWLLRYFFPFDVDGRKVMGKKPNYHAMRVANSNALIEVLRPAGLQNKKAYVIKNILTAIYEINVTRENARAVASGKPVTGPVPQSAAQEAGNINIEPTTQGDQAPDNMFAIPAGVDTSGVQADVGVPLDSISIGSSTSSSPSTLGDSATVGRDASPPKSITTDTTVPNIPFERLRGNVWELQIEQSPDFVPELLSVTYLQTLGDQDLFNKLVSHEGVGVKTAACIMAFNLGRPIFAVDIHVFRMCKFLGWSPKGLDENKTCELLDFIVPNDIKYGLHQAFWHHGQKCVRCRSGATEKRAGWEKGCPLEQYVDRSRYVPVESKAQKERKAEKEAEELKKAVEVSESTKKQSAGVKSKSGNKNAKNEEDTSQKSLKASFKVVKTPTDTKVEAEDQNMAEDQNIADNLENEQSSPKQEKDMKEGAKPSRKRKADDNGDSQQLGISEDGTLRLVKKSKLEQPPMEEEQDVEYAEIDIHDDFDAGRNQNITRTLRFKIPKIKF